jgi:hypothetical protein
VAGMLAPRLLRRRPAEELPEDEFASRNALLIDRL